MVHAQAAIFGVCPKWERRWCKHGGLMALRSATMRHKVWQLCLLKSSDRIGFCRIDIESLRMERSLEPSSLEHGFFRRSWMWLWVKTLARVTGYSWLMDAYSPSPQNIARIVGSESSIYDFAAHLRQPDSGWSWPHPKKWPAICGSI